MRTRLPAPLNDIRPPLENSSTAGRSEDLTSYVDCSAQYVLQVQDVEKNRSTNMVRHTLGEGDFLQCQVTNMCVDDLTKGPSDSSVFAHILPICSSSFRGIMRLSGSIAEDPQSKHGNSFKDGMTMVTSSLATSKMFDFMIEMGSTGVST